jgi:hypothetical protein
MNYIGLSERMWKTICVSKKITNTWQMLIWVMKIVFMPVNQVDLGQDKITGNVK